MRFQAFSEDEVSSFDLLPGGEYRFEVADADEGKSKAGNEMISLKVKVHTGDGSTRIIFDYLVSGEKTAYKVRHFCDTTGLLAEYEAGNLSAEDCKGASGKCVVGQQPAQNGYAAKNTIRDYVKSEVAADAPKPAAKPTTASKARDKMNDEIPW